MFWVGAAGLVISLFLYFTVKETRTKYKKNDTMVMEPYGSDGVEGEYKSLDNREILKENLSTDNDAQNVPKTKLSLFQITKKLLSTDTFLVS